MILFSKFSNERRRELAIRTDIIEENGRRVVRKSPFTEAARSHVLRMADREEELKKQYASSKFVPNVCHAGDSYADFEYLEGKTLEEAADAALDEGEDKLREFLRAFFTEVDKTVDCSFHETPEFREVFGSAELLEGSGASSHPNIDLVFANVITIGDTWNVIDYEWTFDFAVPIDFIKWRVLHYYSQSGKKRGLAANRDIYEAVGLTPAKMQLFSSMEKHFQKWVEGEHTPIRDLYADITPGVVSLEGLKQNSGEQANLSPAKIYLDAGEGYSEEVAISINQNQDGSFSREIDIRGAKSIRIDPTESFSYVHFDRLAIDGEDMKIPELKTNGVSSGPETLLFDTDDPKIYIENEGGAAARLDIAFHAVSLTQQAASFMAKELLAKETSWYARVYIDRGEGFSEADALHISYDEDGNLAADIPLVGVKQVRIDPTEGCGYLKIDGLYTDQGALPDGGSVISGTRIAHHEHVFTEPDPSVRIVNWRKGSRMLIVRFRFSPLSKTAAEAFIAKRKEDESEISRLTNISVHRLQLLKERSDMLNYAANLRSIRAYRKMCAMRKKPDPFEKARPVLPNDPNGICYNIDKISYHRDVLLLRGWCCDKDYGIDMIRIVDSLGNEIPIRVLRVKRPDVAAHFGLQAGGGYGFTITVKYSDLVNLPAFLEIGDVRGFCREQLKYEPDLSKRPKETGAEASLATDYNDWAMDRRVSDEELKRQRETKFSYEPLISVVVPLYKTPEHYLRELVASFTAQSYPKWELVFSDGSGPDSPLTGLLEELKKEEPRIRTVYTGKQLQISENTNQAIAAAKGDFIAFCDHDDLVTSDALFENVKVINEHPETEMIYSDEDKVNDEGFYSEPNFKPDFNYDLLNVNNYICHLTVVKRALLDKVGMLDPKFDGAQDFDFVLRCSEATKNIRHIPKVLYHWRVSGNSTAENPESKRYAFDAGRRAVEAHYRRTGIHAKVIDGSSLGIYRSIYRIEGEPLISIIIPNKDHTDDLDKCVRAIETKSSYRNFEFIIVENNSTDPKTFEYYEKLKKEFPDDIHMVTYKGSFNYSAINNLGVKSAKGDYLLFLNNDTEIINKTCLTEMLGFCQKPDVGAVGARLYYDDDTVQHAGVLIGLGGIAGHPFSRFPRNATGYMNRMVVAQDLSAVTAACMMVKKSVFEKVGGFYEGLAVAFNDVDFCMKVTRAGYRVVYNPFAELYHYESKSRGQEDTPEKKKRFEHEVAMFAERWPDILKNGDPYYNPNLTLRRGGYELKDEDE